MVENYPIINAPFLYKYGLRLQNSTVSPATKLSLLAGFCRDVNNVIDIDLGDNNPNALGSITSAPIRIDNTVSGPGGIAQGELVTPNTMYAIYIIADSRDYLPLSALATNSINVYEVPGPSMPFGYDSYRFIGFWPTDSSSYWQTGYYFGLGSDLTFFYDTPQITAITAGTSNTYANVNLNNLVPLYSNIPVYLYTVFNPGAAGDTLSLRAGLSLSSFGQSVITGQVASVNTTSISTVLAQNVSISPPFPSPVVQYKVSGADTVAIYVSGFSVSGAQFVPV
jgi:hypothetical protein